MENLQKNTTSGGGTSGGTATATATATADGGKNTIIMNILKGNKMGKILLFLFIFFFIFKIIDYIFIFFDVNRESGYTYFIWFMILFFWFVLLPLRASYLYSKPMSKSDAGTEKGGPPVSATAPSAPSAPVRGTGSPPSGPVTGAEGAEGPEEEAELTGSNDFARILSDPEESLPPPSLPTLSEESINNTLLWGNSTLTSHLPDDYLSNQTIKLKDDPMYAKYFKMLKMHLPPPAVKQKMTADGLDSSILDRNPNDPSPNQKRVGT